MSSDPTSDDEQSVIDDGTLSDVVRRPTRTAGDLSEVADASAGITLEELLRRVRRMENEISELRESVRRIERNIASMPSLPGGQVSPREKPELAGVSDTFGHLAGMQEESESRGRSG
jgi:hypothetical protein